MIYPRLPELRCIGCGQLVRWISPVGTGLICKPCQLFYEMVLDQVEEAGDPHPLSDRKCLHCSSDNFWTFGPYHSQCRGCGAVYDLN